MFLAPGFCDAKGRQASQSLRPCLLQRCEFSFGLLDLGSKVFVARHGESIVPSGEVSGKTSWIGLSSGNPPEL